MEKIKPIALGILLKDENIGNHGCIGTSILRIYRIYRRIF